MTCSIRKLNNNPEYLDIVKNYLHEVDEDFEIPISSKTSMSDFCEKLLQSGNVYSVFEDEILVALIGFYCNDNVNRIAYFSFLSTRLGARKKGYARLLVKEMIEVCKESGMKEILCDSVNPNAVALYQSLGFFCYDEIVVHGFQKVLMKLKLNDSNFK